MPVDERLERVLAAWSITPGLNDPNAGASGADIETAEARLGRPLPAVMRDLYSALNGGSMLEGTLNLLPLLSDSGKLALTTASNLLRSWEWPVPDELVIFGDEGADDQLGIWLPATGAGRPIVVSMGAVFEERSFAVVGDDLAGFLLARSAYSLLLSSDDPEETAGALEALGVPGQLRSLDEDGSDVESDALLTWANPGLPDPHPDAYRRGLTATEVAELARRA
jgi:hypothetical protein